MWSTIEKVSVVIAIVVVVWLAYSGFPLPGDERLKNFFAFVLGPLGAFGGYAAGFWIMKSENYWKGGRILFIICLVIIVGFLSSGGYYFMVRRPSSPGTLEMLGEGGAFLVAFVCLFLLAALGGLRISPESKD